MPISTQARSPLPFPEPPQLLSGDGGNFSASREMACRHFCSSGHQLSPNFCSSGGIASGEFLLLRGSTRFLCFGGNCLWQLGSHMMLGTPTHLIGGLVNSLSTWTLLNPDAQSWAKTCATVCGPILPMGESQWHCTSMILLILA